MWVGLIFSPLWTVLAQTPLEELQEIRAAYPDESAVVTHDWRELRIDIVADTLQIISKNHEELLVLNNPSAWVKDKVYSSSFSYVDQVDAYTLVPGKKKYKKIPVAEFKRSFDRDSYVFYDDSEWINFVYPQVEAGAKLVSQYQWASTNPKLLGQFFFADYKPVIRAQYRIVTDPGVRLDYHLFNQDHAKVELKEYLDEAGKQVYEFTATDIAKVKYEQDNPSFKYLAPSVYVRIAGYERSDGTYQPVLSSLDDLHGWYRTFLEGRLEDADAMKPLVAEVISEGDTELEKIRKIFYWVQNNVRYIAFEQGMRGFVPHPAQYVLEKRYGDCKDMSSLLVAALRSAGIPANFTWIGSRNLPYLYSEVPAPIVDDHMIASVDLKGTRIFLDATGSYTPLGYPTSMIQGKEALVSLDGARYKVEAVPVIPKEQNLMVDTTYVRLEGGQLIGKGETSLTGLVRVANNHKLISRTASGEERYLRRLLSKGSNKFILGSYVLQHVDDLDQPIGITYDFTVGDYYNAINDELYVNPYLDKSLVGDLIKDRATPRENDYKYMNRSVTILELPEGYEPSFIPEDVSGTWDHFGFSISHAHEGDQVRVTKVFYVDYLLLEPGDFDHWNEGIKTYSQALRNTVILKKTTN